MYHNQYANNNGSDMYGYLMMMCILPLATSFSQEIIKMLIDMLRSMKSYIENNYYRRFKKMNILKIKMTQCISKGSWNNSVDLSEKGLYISKYLKKYHLEKMSSLTLFGSNGDIIPIKYENYDTSDQTKDDSDEKSGKSKSTQNFVNSTKFYYENDTDIHLENGIFINFQSELLKEMSYGKILNEGFIITCFLKTKKDPNVLLKFMEKIENDFITDNNNNKEFLTKVFTLETDKKDAVSYIESSYDTTNSFDNLFFDEKENVLNELKILNCVEDGIKNKASLLLCGKSGSGKTAVVLAIAKLLNRCIISIPPSKLNTGNLHEVIYSTKYNKHIIQNNQKLIFFDEIDSVNKIMKKFNSMNNKDLKKLEATKKASSNFIVMNSGEGMGPPMNTPEEVFDVGFLLSLLDGPYDQNGLIFCGTANDINMLDNGLYRNGRFTIFMMDYNDNKNISKMIEYYYKVELNDDVVRSIRNDRVLSNSLLKTMCIKAKVVGKSVDELIREINEYVYVHVEQKKFCLPSSNEKNKKQDDDSNEDDE